jgi:hypothetical protein
MVPWVVLAVKSGAVSPKRTVMVSSKNGKLLLDSRLGAIFLNPTTLVGN